MLGRIVSRKDALNRRTSYIYNEVGSLTSQIAPDGVVTAYAYDPLNRLSFVSENYIPVTPPTNDVNVTTIYQYDPNGNLVEFVNPNGYSTHFEYDSENRVIRETDALNNIWRYAYDGVGNLTERIDAKHDRTEYSYYPDNMLRDVRYPDHTGTHYTYDRTNNLTLVEEVGREIGNTSIGYDVLNRQTSIIDSFGRMLTMTYDAVGNRTSLTYPTESRIITYVYDANDWLESVTVSSQGTSGYTRNNEGYVTSVTHPNNTHTTMVYDAVNQLLSTRTVQTDNNPSLVSASSYRYDLAGMRTQVLFEYGWRQPNSILTLYTYDALRRLTEVRDTQGISAEYEYDAAGNRLRWETSDDPLTSRPNESNDGFIQIFEYNEINQLVRTERDYLYIPPVLIPSTETATPSPTATLEPSVTISATSTLETEVSATPTWTATATATETATATTTDTVMPSATVSPTATATNTATATSTSTFTPTWTPTGTNTPTVTPSPTATATSTNTVTNTPTPPPTINTLLAAIDSACLSLNQGICNSLRTKAEHAQEAVNAGDYEAAIQRLETFISEINNNANGMTPEISSSLNAIAQELINYYSSLSASPDWQIDTIFNSDRLYLQVRSDRNGDPNNGDQAQNHPNGFVASFEYDENGSRAQSLYHYENQTTEGTEYSFDFERRLTNVSNFQIDSPQAERTNGNGRRRYDGLTSYTYNSLGTLLQDSYSVTANSQEFETQYLSDGWDIVGQYDLWDGHNSYFYRDDTSQIVSSEDLWTGGNGAHSWYDYDGLGSVTGITKHIGQSIHNYRYDEYGAVIPETGNFTEPHNDFTFTGKPLDGDTGLYAFGSRHYDPLNSVWIQQDHFRGIVAVPQSLHRYNYVAGNPTNYFDYYGFSWLTDKLNGVKQGTTDLLRKAVDSAANSAHNLWNSVEEYVEIQVNNQVFGQPMTNKQRDQILIQEQYLREATLASKAQRALANTSDCENAAYLSRILNSTYQRRALLSHSYTLTHRGAKTPTKPVIQPLDPNLWSYAQQAGAEFGVPPELVAAVLVAERDHDYGFGDQVEDHLAESMLEMYRIQSSLPYELRHQHAYHESVLGLSLIERIDFTLGKGQLRISTAESIQIPNDVALLPDYEIIRRLEDPQWNVRYVAGHLRQLADMGGTTEFSVEEMQILYGAYRTGPAGLDLSTPGPLGSQLSPDVIEFYRQQ